jgi:hypothetical protein
MDYSYLIKLNISNLREAGGLYLKYILKLTALNIISLANIGIIYI